MAIVNDSDIYNMSNYFSFNEDYGIYDIDIRSEFVSNLKELDFSNVIDLNGQLLDFIAYKFYGIEELWWVIALYNNISDPFSTEGITIKIPRLNLINDLLIKYIDRSS